MPRCRKLDAGCQGLQMAYRHHTLETCSRELQTPPKKTKHNIYQLFIETCLFFCGVGRKVGIIFNVASLRKSERLISSRGHVCSPQLPAAATCRSYPPQLPAAATRRNYLLQLSAAATRRKERLYPLPITLRYQMKFLSKLLNSSTNSNL